MTLLEQTRKAPGFKAYCQRRSTTRTKTIAQVFETARRARQGAIRAYIKPRGINSVLRDQFYDIGDGTIATLKKVNGEFISTYTAPAPAFVGPMPWRVCWQGHALSPSKSMIADCPICNEVAEAA